jgi:hypothetical protein
MVTRVQAALFQRKKYPGNVHRVSLYAVVNIKNIFLPGIKTELLFVQMVS